MPRVRRADVVWVEPRLVAEVAFAEWTHEGRLRAPVYLGIREDKPASEVRREKTPLPSVLKKGRRELRSATWTSLSGRTRGSRRAI